MLAKGAKSSPADTITPEPEIKDPFLLEFLGIVANHPVTSGAAAFHPTHP